MAPGFALLLSVVLLAGLSPVVLAVAIGFIFFDATRPYSSRMVVFGLLGGAAGLALFISIWAFNSYANAALAEHLVVFGAGFTVFALTGTLFPFLRSRWRTTD